MFSSHFYVILTRRTTSNIPPQCIQYFSPFHFPPIFSRWVAISNCNSWWGFELWTLTVQVRKCVLLGCIPVCRPPFLPSFTRLPQVGSCYSRTKSEPLLLLLLLCSTSWTTARQASLSFTISQSLLQLMSIELMMPSNHLILCRPHLLPSIPW